jgi:hypothetical protein
MLTAEMLKVVDENEKLHTNDVLNPFVPKKDFFQCSFDGCTHEYSDKCNSCESDKHYCYEHLEYSNHGKLQNF